MNDWRLTGQEDFLMSAQLKYKKYKPKMPQPVVMNSKFRIYSDHEHCIFCWRKFMENCDNPEDDYCTTIGYCTLDDLTWICEECFNDFHQQFHWTVIGER